MTTLSGITSKGEKGKSKFQSLDINNLYRASRGEPLEHHQHKNPSSRRHGMQTLGKIPSARRAPANLPSLKSEYSGNDPAVSLVPSGGTGWGSKPGETGPPPSSTQAPTSTSTSTTPTPPSVAQPVPATVTVTAPAPPPTPASTAVAPTTNQSHGDKSWSSITSSGSESTPVFLAHQSPYFQQEFPSLSGDAANAGAGPNKGDTSHLPGPSLRPQTEGSWMQGGSRPQGQMAAGAGSQQGTAPAPGPLPLPLSLNHLPQGIDVGGGRSSLAPSGVGGGPAGPPSVAQHHYRLMPQFMLRHPQPGGFPLNYQHNMARPRFPYPPDNRFAPANRGPANSDQEEVTTRPIIKEEDLKVMDEISRDTGWAAHDEIDYNQTLTFSDDEGPQEEDAKKHYNKNVERRDSDNKYVEKDNALNPEEKAIRGGRQGEDDEVWRERRRIQTEEIAIAKERAKQRKEEEEKRYEETRQAAARKLQILEEKMRSKSGGEKEEKTGSPPLNLQHGTNVLLPDWEKEKDKNRSRKNSEEDKSSKDHADNTKNVQVDNRGSFGRDRERDREMRPDRDASGQHSYRQFQNNLPPRFQKQQAADRPPYFRQGSGGSPQPPSSAQPPCDVRWQSGNYLGGSVNSTKMHRNRNDSDVSERDKDENKDANRERDRSSVESGFDNRDRERYEKHEDFNKRKDKEYSFYEESKENESKFHESQKLTHLQGDPFDDKENIGDKVESERRDVPHKLEVRDRERLERPQRPDSRDSRGSRDSRTSRDDKFVEENNLHSVSLSWADSTYETEQKEDKRKKDMRDDRDARRDFPMHTYHQRHIPGPITKEKLEASELKCDPSRNSNLVPLVRSDKKTEQKKNDNQWDMSGTGGDAWQTMSSTPGQPASHTDSWADIISPPAQHQSSELEQGTQAESQQHKVENDDTNKSVSNMSHQERDVEGSHRPDSRRDKMVGRGGNRGLRHDGRGSRHGHGYGNSYYRGGAPMWRGPDMRNKRAPPHRRGPHDCPSNESEEDVSASTESGKEEKRQDQDSKNFQRSPKQSVKKSDERIRDNNRRLDGDKDSYCADSDNHRYEKRELSDGNRIGRGFEPRGEPSRRGRGAPFRSKGSATNVGRIMDGYGPPSSKRPFNKDSSSGHASDDKKVEDSSNSQHKEDSLNRMSHDERIKMNQQQLSAGIIGNSGRMFKTGPANMPPRLRRKSEGERNNRKSREGSRRGPQGAIKSGSGSGGEGELADDNWETTSNSEQEEREQDGEDIKQNDSSRRNYSHHMSSGRGNARRQPGVNSRGNGRERRSGSSFDKDHNVRKPMGNNGPQSMVNGVRPNNKSSGIMKEQDVKTPEQLGDKKMHRPDNKDRRNTLDRYDLSNTANNNGFQEVRSKKNVKESNRQKEEPPKGPKGAKPTKPASSQSPGPPTTVAATAAKGAYNQPRNGKLPPRFAKLRETNRMQKLAQQTQDVNEINKINQGGVTVFPIKDITSPAPPPTVNAWDKPITAALRTSTPPPPASTVAPITSMADTCSMELNEHMASGNSSQRSSPSADNKAANKLPKEPTEKAVLDGTSPPVQTIIFENTNYKSAPVDVAVKSKYSNQLGKPQRPDKPRERKLEEENVALGFKSPGPDMKLQDNKTDPIQMPISFNKNEDNADMKLDFRFESDLTQLTDDKTSKNMTAMQMTRSIQMAAQSSTAELQFKLASVKKVWENPPEHGGEDNSGPATSFTPTFGDDTTGYGKPADPSVSDDGSSLTPEVVYNSGQPLQNNTTAYNGSTVQNMIKPDPSSNLLAPQVKPQPQAAMHPHSGPLSPPSAAFNSSPVQPSQHISYQPQAQYGGISAIPSPPTVFNQQPPELYQTFQINNPQVIGSQGRSQFSQFAPYLSQGLSQTSGYSQQSMYLHQTAPPHPPPSAAPPDMFQNPLSQYRLQGAAYGSTQQNPNTVLISSSTNSLMSASVKPSPQPIGAIGTKGASYQTTSQPPPSQLYIYPDPQMLSQSPYLQNSQLVQRPASNVVPTIPPSSASYYSPSTGGGATGFYQPGNSNMQAAAQSLHQTTFNLQAFNTQSPAGTPAGMGSFGSTLPRLILQNPMPQVGVVGSRVAQPMHRSNSPAPPRTTTSSPRINKMSHRQPSS